MNEIDQSASSSSETETGKFADLGSILLAQGLETWALLGEADLLAMLGSDPASPAKAAIVVALPYDPRPPSEPGAEDQPGAESQSGPEDHPGAEAQTGPEDHPGGPEPYLRVASFAASHFYTALTRLLKATARDLSVITGFAYSSFRVAVNSRLPEKLLAERAGLGFRGRSDLLLTHAYGPACILGLLLLPFDPRTKLAVEIPGPGGLDRQRPCDLCQACADACPGRAIVGRPGSIQYSTDNNAAQYKLAGLQATYTRQACIQHWMSTEEDPPAALRPAFRGQLYGCDACILACPLSAQAWLSDRADGSSPASRAAGLLLPKEKRPGAYISAPFLMQASDAELKAFFRKTALGLSWLGPGLLRRTASLTFDQHQSRH